MDVLLELREELLGDCSISELSEDVKVMGLAFSNVADESADLNEAELLNVYFLLGHQFQKFFHSNLLDLRVVVEQL